MVRNVLYFPTIRVPTSAWFTRVLLYWDCVGTITPYEYVEDPDRHEPHTLRLIRANLVTQIIPSSYVWRIPRFTEAFMEYIENLGATLNERRSAFRNTRGFRIHVDKLDQLKHELTRAGLARRATGAWLEVETATAQEFMAYIAASFGRIEELASVPLTDHARYLRTFIGASSRLDNQLETLRTDILSEILPAPEQALDPEELAHFKDARRDDLRRFRNRVEQKLVELAALPDESLRRRAAELFQQEVEDEIESLRDEMANRGWVRTTLTKVSSVVSAVPGASPIVGLAASVISAFGDDARGSQRSPFLYAAEAQRLLEG